MIESIRLQHFRSYNDRTFEFAPGVNIIAGPNASGKTNLLESILVLARGSSYRVKDRELISFGEDWARLDAVLTDTPPRIVKLQAVQHPSKQYEIDSKIFVRLTHKHTLPVVLFEPNHLQLLHGAPEQRRTYLDDLLEQRQPNFAAHRRNYRRVLSHRNALLKRSRLPSIEEIFPWNLRLTELGAVISRSRAALIREIETDLMHTYGDISETNTDIGITYHNQFPIESYESHMLHKLESNRETDLARGFTTSGPHREDFTITFNGKPAEETASRGETRSAVLTLKVIELKQLHKTFANKPLLLLDDVFSELDASRRHALTSQLNSYQTFITTTDADIVLKNFAAKAKIITTENK